jgi:hypothetical protein
MNAGLRAVELTVVETNTAERGAFPSSNRIRSDRDVVVDSQQQARGLRFGTPTFNSGPGLRAAGRCVRRP